MSPVMITRLVVPVPEFESNIKGGMLSGVYTEEPINFGDLREAFAVLDQQAIWELVLAAGLETMARALLRNSDLSLTEFMRHALATASGTKAIATHFQLPESDLFAAGLLHNIGILIIANAHPIEYNQILSTIAGSQQTLEDAERNVFGFTHEEAGGTFLMSMITPDVIWQAAFDHHSSAETNDLVIGSVRLSANISHQVGCSLGLANGHSSIPAGLVSKIGLNDVAMASMAQKMGEAAVKASKLT